MEEKPINLQEMFRRALRTQVELGMGEVIISKEERFSENSQLEERPPLIEKLTEPGDLFGAASKVVCAPQYDSLQAQYEAICNCNLCPLWQTRTKLVFGIGNLHAGLMFIGEAPGRDEDLQGEPFVGRAGQLLDRILVAINLSRQDVYIANILKCRPPNNRDPLPGEVEKCLPHLQEQIRLIKPRLICALGRISGQILLKTNTPLGKLREQWHEVEGIPLMVTYHPAALLRFPAYKKETWADMQALKERYDELRKT